jgi:hypothetical protein
MASTQGEDASHDYDGHIWMVTGSISLGLYFELNFILNQVELQYVDILDDPLVRQ